MELGKALARAVVFTWGGKQNSPLNCVRLLPPMEGSISRWEQSSRVYANDSQSGALIRVDGVLPDISIRGDTLKTALKAIKGPIDSIAADGTIRAGNATAKVALGDAKLYPAVPCPPSLGGCWTIGDWPYVSRALHAVSKDPQQSHLCGIHFVPDKAVEATDRMRVVRVFIATPFTGFVGSDVFRGWNTPAPPSVTGRFLEREAWFSPDPSDEWYMGAMRPKPNYPDLEAVLPAVYGGAICSVDTGALELVLSAAPVAAVYCELTLQPRAPVGSEYTAHIRAGDLRYEVDVMQLQALTTGDECVLLSVNTRWLRSAVRCVGTPRVGLGYTHAQDPLRVESGPFVEGIWPYQGGAS